MAGDIRVRVVGLDRFNRQLRAADRDLPKMTRHALNTVADVVIREAKPTVPKRTGRAVASIRAASTRNLVRVRAGGSRAKHYPWLDFGGTVGRGKTGPGTGSVRRQFRRYGRYLYKAYFRIRDRGAIHRSISHALNKVVRAAGIAVD